jgi:hypothetical protein
VAVMLAGAPELSITEKADTEKAALSTSAPVVTTTWSGPTFAFEAITMLAVAVVRLVTVTVPAVPAAAPPTEIPGPKLAVVPPCKKFE